MTYIPSALLLTFHTYLYIHVYLHMFPYAVGPLLIASFEKLYIYSPPYTRNCHAHTINVIDFGIVTSPMVIDFV